MENDWMIDEDEMREEVSPSKEETSDRTLKRVYPTQPGYKRYMMLRAIKNPRWFRIADAISDRLERTHRYTEWKNATCGGKQGVLSMYIDQECSGSLRGIACPRPVRFLYSERTETVKLGCCGPRCPVTVYTVDWGRDGTCTLCREPTVQTETQETPVPQVQTERDEPDSMMEAAQSSGLKLALALRRFVGDEPQNVFDGKQWWYYEPTEHMWKVDMSNTHIQVEVTKIAETHFKAWIRGLGVGASVHEKTDIVNKLLHNMDTRLFRERLVKDCASTFLDPKFRNRLNSQKHLIVCKNGVFDLKRQEFRPGRPSDYCSMSTHRTFRSQRVDKISMGCVKFLLDLFDRGNENDTEQVMECMLQAAAWHLGGGTYTKFFVWVGEGANGKSKFASLFRLSFGDYVGNLPTQLVTQKRMDPGKACPELDRFGDKRLGYISEPAQNETLNMGIIKELTGGDAMFNRGLYSDGSEKTYTFQINLLSNECPNITGRTEGDWRRIELCHFLSKFCANPDPRNPFEKHMDPDLDEKLDYWADSFMSFMLTEVYPRCAPHLKIPDCMRQAHTQYREEEDIFHNFFKERAVKTSTTLDRISWTNWYNMFEESVRRSIGRQNMPKKKVAKDAFEKCFGAKLHKGEWVGWQMPGNCTAAF